MKNKSLSFLLLLTLLVSPIYANDLPNFTTGSPEIQSVNALAFSPDGVLFVGDAQSAKVFAIITNDSPEAEKVENISIAS